MQIQDHMIEPLMSLIGLVAVALISLTGTIVTAVLTHKSNKRSKISEAEARAKEEAEEQKKIAQDAKDALARQKREEAFAKLRSEMTDGFRRIGDVARDIGVLGDRVSNMNLKLGARISDTEDNIRQITQVLSKYGKTYSGLTMMHAQTNKQLSQLMEMEGCNLKYTKQVGDVLKDFIDVASDLHPDDPNIRAIRKVVDDLVVSRTAFISAIIDNAIGGTTSDIARITLPPDITEGITDINSTDIFNQLTSDNL